MDSNDPTQVAIDAQSHTGGRLANVVSAIALTFSGYSVWETSLKQSDLKVFVAPVIQYASPYNNSNFEMLAIPITITNEGARTGTILSAELLVTDPEKKLSKRFYSADFGRWSVENARTGNFKPFAPMSLAGRASQTETILFHPRRDETVMQLIAATGRYQFTLKLNVALTEDFGFLDRAWRKAPDPLSFEMILPVLDHRAFTSGAGSLPMHHKDWQTTASGG